MKRFVFLVFALSIGLFSSASARDRIQIVGSSTVFPFATSVAETFGQYTSHKTPVVESTGSGGGMKLFCGGVGASTPDITNASRRIKKSEYDQCRSAGVTPIEVQIGFDGIVIGSSQDGISLELTLEHIYNALAKEVVIDGALVPNPHKLWSDVDSSLPSSRIEVLGPPPTSGTRDAFAELALEGGARRIPFLADLRESDKKAFTKIAHAVREDGAYIEAGENDNLIVQKLEANPDAIGVFGFSFLDQNYDRLQGTPIDGVEPEFELIASGEYPVSRSLFFYVKKEHIGVTPGIEEYIEEFTKEDTWGDDGYLTEKGLIPLPEEDRAKVMEDARSLKPLSM